MKKESANYKEWYFNWKEKAKDGIPEISKDNSDLILKFINDMERGLNISNGSKKGARSFARLNSLKDRLIFFSRNFQQYFNIDDITKISEEQLITFFNDMRNGKITKKDGKAYKSVADYVKTFKCLWHWYVKVKKKEEGRFIEDITLDLDTKREKPKWVYLTEEQVKKLCDNAKYEYKVLMWLLYDTGIRLTELINLKVSDLFDNYTKLKIRGEISKTFERKFNLVLCSDFLREYIKNNNLQSDAYLFPIDAKAVNKYFKRLAERVLGNELSQAGEKYSNLTIYNFRHNSACYWLPIYKNESGLKYRFGWKETKMIHYYTELLGMKDTISKEDLIIDINKADIENKLMKAEQERDLFKERLELLEKQLKQIQELTNEMHKKLIR